MTLLRDPLDRAYAAYYRFHDGAHQQPQASLSGEETAEGRRYVVLRNVDGILAVYRITNAGQLKGLRRWPKSLEEW